MSRAATIDGRTRAGETGRYECRICWHLYDPSEGDPLEQIPAGTAFTDLPGHWRCPQCDAEPFAFLPVDE